MDRSNKESGFVSLFTVIFFMLLVTVITVSFVRIMITEQRQAIDNDLSANARAAAESGVEDGKRALLAYYDSSTPSDVRAELAQAFGADSNNCDSLTGKTQVRAQLNITGQAVTTGDIEQDYTCLNVKLNSPDYVDSSSANTSKVFPIRGTGDYNQIRVSWHLLSENVSEDADGRPSALAPNAPLPLLPPQTGANSWSTFGYPAFLRVQLLGYPSSGSFNRSDLDTRSRSVFLAPVNGSSTVIDLGTADSGHQFDSTKSSPSPFVQCSTNFNNYGAYLCTATLQLPAGLASNANNFFLRVTPIYSSTHFRVQLYNSSTNSSVDMNEVQPLIDSTGKSQDVFRRIQVRVRLNPLTSFPEFAAETTDNICKNMRVADAANSSVNNCP